MRIWRGRCKSCGKVLSMLENDYCFECKKSNEYVNACVKIKVPKWQIGQEVSVYFKDTMYIKGICEREE